MNENQAVTILDKCYDLALNGVALVSEPVKSLADEYIGKYGRTDKAIDKMVASQIAKCGTSGFISGLGGLITMPITIPANVSSVLYVQLRMVAAIAYINGYDPMSDEVQTRAYCCLLGRGMGEFAKQAGIKVGTKMANNAVNKISGKALIEINKKVGMKLFTKAGEKGIINFIKFVPLAGGVVGGIFDVATTNIIAANAKKHFARN